jgi:hypothetical protein
MIREVSQKNRKRKKEGFRVESDDSEHDLRNLKSDPILDNFITKKEERRDLVGTEMVFPSGGTDF